MGKIRQQKLYRWRQATYLHLGPLVLEPKLDLPGRKLQLPAKFLSLLLVWVGAFLEEPAKEDSQSLEIKLNTYDLRHV